MNNISVTPKGGTVASELSGNQVNLTAPSLVKLHLNQSDIKSFTRNGNDLVVTTKSGEVVVIHNFYSPNGDSDLVLQDDRGAMWWVEDPGTEGFQYVSIDSTEGLLAENTTNNGTIAAFGIGGAALAGIGALVAGSGGGGGGGGGGTTTPGDDNGGNPTNPTDPTTPTNPSNPGGDDTSPPTAISDLVISDAVGPYQGAINAGSITDDNAPTLSGTAEAGAIVSIYDGTTLLGTVTVGADGRWSFTTPALADGQHSLTATVTDAAGNTSAATNPVDFTVDTVAPVAATGLSLSDNSGGNTGSVPNGASTDDNTPTLSGSGEVGAIISVYDGQTLLGTAIVDANGAWSFTTPALANGNHSLTVTQTDVAGNVGPASEAYGVNIQAGIPPATTSLEITDDSGNTLVQLSNGASTQDTTPTLSGLATAGALITLYNGTTVLGSVVAGSDGQWTFTPAALVDGTYALQASVTDPSGNVTQTPIITITIDTVAPAEAASVILNDSDGGVLQPIASGGATNNVTPVLSGTAEPGSTVTVRDGDTVLGTATVGSNGAWSFTSPTLAEGGHSLTTTVTDAAGNEGPASSPITFTVDTQAPQPASNLLVNDDTSGANSPITAGATTSDSTPTLTGSGEVNAIVKIYDGQTLIGSVTVGNDGTWSFTTPALNNGAHALTVTVTDAAGNVSDASAEFGFTVEAGVPPTTSLLEITDDTGSTLRVLPDGSSTQDDTPTLSGLASAGATVELYNGTTLLGTAIAGADGQWNFTPDLPLDDGTYAFRATSTDANGITTDSATLNITIDHVAPAAATDLQLSNNSGSTVVPIEPGGTTNDSSPSLSGTAEPGSTVTILDGTNVLGTTTVDSNGSWRFTSPTLSEGAHSLTTTVTDPAGNIGPASDPITLTVDTTPPVAVADLIIADNVGANQGPLTSGDITDDRTPTLSGTGEPNATISVYDGTTLLGITSVGTNGSWSFTTPTLSNGQHSFTVTATDTAGNVGPATPPVIVNVNADVPPATASLEVTDENGNTVGQLTDGASTNNDSPVLTGLAGAGNLITLYDGDTLLGSTTADTNGQWIFYVRNLANGAHALHGTITDANGNVTDTATINIIVDTVVPDAASAIELTNDAGNITQPITAGSASNDATPVLSGSAEAGSTVTIFDGTTVLGSITVGSDGNWSFTTPTLADGNHSLTTTVTDAAGNVSLATAPIAFSVDTTAPAAVTGLAVTDNVGSSTGVLTSGTTTDDSTPTLTGSAEAGSVVRVYDGTTLLGSAAVGNDGSWSFTPDAALTNGLHSLTTTVTDAAGNVSAPSPAFNLNVDAGVPTTNSLIVVTDDSGSTLVELANNASTHDTTPILSGQAGAGDLITLYNGDTVIGSVVAGSDGQWNFTPAALTDATYAFHATATNATTGEITDSPTINITVDTSIPDAPGDVGVTDGSGVPIPEGSSTNNNTPTLSGTGEVGSTVTISDGTTVLGTTTVGDNGSWSYTTPPLSDGDHSLTSTVTDPAGNTGPASTPITLTVDTLPPAAAGNVQFSSDDGTPIAAGSSTSDTTPTLSGTAEPGSTVTVSDGTAVLGTAITGTDGNWSYTPTDPLSEGTHNLTTTVTDTAGNVGPSSSAVIVIVDTTPPAVATGLQLSNDSTGTLVPVTEGGTTNDVTPVLSGRAEPGSIVTISDNNVELGTAIVGNDGNWSFTSPTLGAGAHSLTTTVTDTAGNTGDPSAPLTFNIDVTIPDAPTNLALNNDAGGAAVPINSGDASNDNTPVLSGSAPEGSIITVSDGGTVLGTVTVGSGGDWSFTTPELNEGSHSLTATVTSPAGNTSAPTAPIVVVVDTVAPDAAGNLQLNNDSGATPVPIAAGDTTNDTTPVFSGSAEAGSLVIVSDNDTPIGSVIAGSDGSWSFTPTDPLDDGFHSLTTTVTDPAGNVGQASNPIEFNIDTSLPPASGGIALNNNEGTDLLPIAAGDATNDTTPVLSGTSAVGNIITVLDGTSILGTAVVGADGTWSFITPALSQGDHSLTTTVTNSVGNVSEPSIPLTFTVDTQAPAVAGDLQFANDAGTPIAAGGSTNDTTPTLSGTAEAGSTVTVTDGATVLGTAITNGEGNWSFTPAEPLSEGSHSLTTTVTDPAGNTSAPSTAVIVIVDTSTPGEVDNLQLSNDASGVAVPIPTNGATNDTTPVLSGTADAGSVITIRDNGEIIGSTTVGTNGNWSFTPDPALLEGDHSLTAAVTDPAGNVGPESGAIVFEVDTTAPDAIADLAATNNAGEPITGLTNDTTPLLAGSAEPGSLVTIYDGETPIGSVQASAIDGSWSFTPATALGDGPHTLSATATDAAGNESPASNTLTINIDTAVPDAPDFVLNNNNQTPAIPVTDGASTNDSTPVLSGTATANSVITIYDGTTALGTANTDAQGNWSFTTPVLSDASHALSITVTNEVGNVSPNSAALTITVDTVTPDVVNDLVVNNNDGTTLIPVAEGGFTNDTTPELTGTAEPGALVTLYDGQEEIGSVVVGGNGNWTYTSTLGQGEHILSVTVTDAAGNTSANSDPVTFTVDSEAPGVAADVQLINVDTPIEPGSTINNNQPQLAGTAEPNSIITLLDGTTVLGTVTADDQGNWSVSPTLTDGTHNLSVTVTDAAGNTSGASASIAVTIDTIAPEAVTNLTLTNDLTNADIPNGGLTNDNTPTLSGVAEVGSIITISEGNAELGSVRVDSEGNWSFTLESALLDGLHTLSVTATDVAGNVSAPAIIGVDVDATAPEVAGNISLTNDINNPPTAITNGSTTGDNTPLLAGTAEAGSLVRISDNGVEIGSVTVGDDGQWSFNLPLLGNADHSLSVTVTDVAGNTGEASPPLTFTVDAEIPDPATLVANNDSSGSPVAITEGATTNDNTPLLTGTAEANSLISIYDGTTLIASTTANVDGLWSINTPVLTDGSHTLTAIVTDELGNVSQPSTGFTVVVDATAPEPVSDLLLQNDNNVDLPVTIANGGITNDNTPALSGAAEVGALVTVYDGNSTTPIGSAVVGQDGRWTLNTDTLSNATHTLNITVTDDAGNVSATSSVTVTVNTVAPDPVLSFDVYNNANATPVVVDNNGFSNDSTPELRGTGVAGTTINLIQDGVVIGTTTVGENGEWRFETANLTDGSYAFSVSVNDAAGNTSEPSGPITITVDTVAPAAIALGDLVVSDDVGTPGNLLPGATTDDSTPTLSGSAVNGEIISVYDGTTLLGTAVAANGSWSFTPGQLSNGPHSFTVTVTDQAGNIGDASEPFTLNIEAALPPASTTLEITDDSGSTLVSLQEGAFTKDSTPVISGLATAGEIITVYNNGEVLGNVTAGDDGQWSLTPAALDEGVHAITIAVNGGAQSDPFTITVDTSAPAVATSLQANSDSSGIQVPITNGISNDSTPILNGLAEANGRVTIYDGNTVIGTAIANGTGEWSFNSPTLSQGAHALSVTVTDAAGNVSDRSAPLALTVDSIAPNASTLVITNDVTSVAVPNGGTTNDSTPTLSGSAEVGSIVTISDGNGELTSLTVDGTGNWSYTTAELTTGSHALTVTVTDAAGNVSDITSATVIIDTTAPAAVTVAATNNNGSSAVPITEGGRTNDTTPALSGTAEAGSLVIIRENGTAIGSVTAGSGGTWSFTTAALAEGTHTFSITATDTAGNISTPVTSTLIVDTTAPVAVTNLTVTNDVTGAVIANGGATNDTTPTLSGTAEANGIVTVYENNTVLGTAIANAVGVWSFQSPTLANGAHPLSVTVTDTAGNVGPRSAVTNVVIDTVAPTASTLVVTNDASAVVPNGGATNDTTPTLSGSAEAGSIVTIRDGLTILGSLTVGETGNWSYTTTALAAGISHPLNVFVTDPAGNLSATTTANITIDTTAPAAVTLGTANNNGSTPVPIAAGGTTNDSTPALSGTAEAGSLVIIRENGVPIGSVTAGSNGAWSFTTATLADGSHTFSVTATDAAGNVSTPVTTTLIVDTTAPLAVTNLVITNDVTNAVVPNGGATNDNTPTLSGNTEANGIVTVYEGTTVLGTAVANAQGGWSFVSPTLANGSHALSVTVTDAAGNVGPRSAAATVVIDTVAPTASTLVITNDVTSAVVPNGGATNDTTPTLSGSAEAGSIVTLRDGSLILGSLTVGGSGNWTYTTSALNQGSHPISVTVTDAAGNVSGTTTATVIIDTTPPAAVTLAAANNNGSNTVPIVEGGRTNDSTPALSGTAEAGSLVIIRENGTPIGSVTAGSNGAWSFTTATLAEGAHTFSVTATDAAGNVNTPVTTTLIVDTTAPVAVTNLVVTNDITNTPVANGASTNDTTPTLSGTTEANGIVTVYDNNTVLGTAVADAQGVWSFVSPTLANGTHPLSVTVTDAAGNVGPRSAATSVVIDTVAPTASTLVITNDVTNTVVPSGGSTNDTTPTLSGTAEVGSRVSIFDGGNLLGTVTVGSGGTWSFTTAALTQGTHPLSVSVADGAGNVSGTTSASVIIDTVAPAAVTNLVAANNNGSTAVTIPNNGITNDSTPLLTGSGEVGARISVYDGAVLLGTTTVGSNGTWSFISTALNNGPHTLNVTATDAAGNVSPTVSTTLTIDTVAPVASTLTITDDAGSTPVTLANGAYTRDTTPVLSGTAEVGAILTIFDGSNALGSVTVGAGGAWTFTTAVLANGAHPLSVTVTDAAGNVSANTAVTVNVDTVPPAVVSALAIDNAGSVVTGSGEVGATVTVRDANGASIGTATVGAGGTWSVNLTTAQTTGASLSVIQTDRAGNVSSSAPLLGAIRVVANNDTNEVDYSTTQATINNGTTSVSHVALANVGLGSILNASVLTNGNAYVFNVGTDDSRTVTLNGSVAGISLISTYSMYLYEQQTNGTWLLINTRGNYLSTGLISLGTQTGANVTYSNLGTGTYAVVIGSNVSVSLLPTTTISTVSDFTTLAVTVAATVTGNLLTNDTSSVAGTIPASAAITTVSGSAVAANGNTVINTTYGTLTIDSHGNYTYALKAGLNIDTLPTADTFTYSVRDASGTVTSASLTVNLHNGASATTLLAANSLFAETTSGDHDASGSIYGSASGTHTGTLSITNEHGDITTVHSVGSTSVAGDFGVLSIAANGNYTYSLNAGVDGQSITHKEVFSYTLAASDGTITTQSFTIELHPTITGTTGADTLTGGAYDDTITSGAGADTLVYHLLASADATGGNGHDTWTDFNVAQGDKVDVSNLLIGWNDSTSNINDFVKVDHTSDGNTVLSIDRDGTGTGYSTTQLITLEGVNVSLEELLQQPHQNHTA
ncbi:Ig-like domain-containing protein [Pantoea endophytica]|uniref:Ig-like domain-containing protein n=1 Tax=Pantoea endophytica TaxID=92488 RepID=UPI0024138D72|nr:Ig-like domain-containing protein [Pantoea endophytica]